MARGSALRTINLFANALVGLLLTPMIVHALGDRNYGLWALVASFIGYYGLLDLGLTSAATRYVSRAIGAQDEEECNRVFHTALVVYLGMGGIALLITGALAALAPIWAKQPGDASLFAELILIMGAYTAAGIPLRAYVGTLNAAMHFDLTAGLEVLSLAIRAVAIIVVVKLHYGLLALAAATALSALPSMVLNILWLYRKLGFLRFHRRFIERATARRLFSYGAYTFVSQIADMFRFGIDSLVVSAYVGLAAVTHYNIGSLLVQYFINVMLALLGVLTSVFSQKEGARDLEGMKRAFYFSLKLSMWTAAFIGFGLMFWGRAFILRWMGPAYADAYPVLFVLALGLTFGLAQMPAVTLLYATSNHRFYALVNTCEAGANVVLSLILVHRYGMLGVALGTCIPMLVVKLFIQPVYFCRLCQIPFGEYMGRVLRSSALIAIGLAVPALLAWRVLQPTYPSLVTIGLVSAAIYALPLFLLELSSNERDLLFHATIPALARR